MSEQQLKQEPLQKGGATNEKQSTPKGTRTKSNAKSSGNSIKAGHSANGKNGQHDGSPNGNESTKMDPAQEVIVQESLDLDHYKVPDFAIAKPDITPYITNPTGNVYGITNLPEEFIAVLFAWVSRSPKSFKEHLRLALQEGHIQASDSKDALQVLSDKAKTFHEKWTVGYGHSSVAEHAVAHVGIEKVSRLASAELELSNEYYSITEYSQRYQKPERGQWYNPFDVHAANEHWMKYNDFMHRCFDVFEQLIEGVYRHLKEKEKNNLQVQSVKVQMAHDNALRKLAFEDARYALPLAIYSQLGMTANGRAWRDGIVTLQNSNYSESVKLAQDIKTEVTKILPTLLKYANLSEYKERSKKRVNHHFARKALVNGLSPTAKLLQFPNEEEAITNLVALLFVKLQGLSYDEGLLRAKHMSWDRRSEIIQDMIFEMGNHDNPPEEFKYVQYQAEFLVSEANWHQLLRHNRKTHFVFNDPSPYHGVTIPPRIMEAGLEDSLKDLALQSLEFYDELDESIAGYVVLNAHRRRIVASFDLWEAYHLINLRTSDEAQWDIRETFNELHHQLSFVHPRLIQYAKRR